MLSRTFDDKFDVILFVDLGVHATRVGEEDASSVWEITSTARDGEERIGQGLFVRDASHFQLLFLVIAEKIYGRVRAKKVVLVKRRKSACGRRHA